MHQWLATVAKELLLLRRDRAGLAVLFVMPTCLVLVVSLIQDHILRSTLDTAIAVLVVNEDRDEVGNRLDAYLREATGFTVETTQHGQPLSRDAALHALDRGQAQVAVIVPAGTTARLRADAARLARTVLTPAAAAPEPAAAVSPAAGAGVQILFEPTVQGGFQTAVSQAIARLALSIEMAERVRQLQAVLPEQIGRLVQEAIARELPSDAGPVTPESPALALRWESAPLLAVRTECALGGRVGGMPNSVQQNVPAWALFGMFFIVVPLAGSLLRERDQGTLRRLLVMPVCPAVILLGKVTAYLLVCGGQFALMLAVGRYVLPRLGTPVLTIGSAPVALGVLVLASALAATCYGILVGTLARSYEQASMFGAVSVVMAAAVGGIMVPVYVMPHVMRSLSQASPLAWAHRAFLDLFVRGGDLSTIWPQVLALGAFAAVCLAVASALLFRRAQAG